MAAIIAGVVVVLAGLGYFMWNRGEGASSGPPAGAEKYGDPNAMMDKMKDKYQGQTRGAPGARPGYPARP